MKDFQADGAAVRLEVCLGPLCPIILPGSAAKWVQNRVPNSRTRLPGQPWKDLFMPQELPTSLQSVPIKLTNATYHSFNFPPSSTVPMRKAA